MKNEDNGVLVHIPVKKSADLSDYIHSSPPSLYLLLAKSFRMLFNIFFERTLFPKMPWINLIEDR